jgi:hypothetical protein
MPRIQINYHDSDPNSGSGGSHTLDLGSYIGEPTDQEIRDLADYMIANLTAGPSGPSTITLTSIDRLDMTEPISLNP